MRATRALVSKELHQNAGRLIAATLLLLIAWATAWGAARQGEGMMSTFQVVAAFAGWPLVSASLYLGHGIVVVELFGRTQRFLEALPIHKGHALLVKMAFGLMALGAWAALALIAGAAMATEPTEPRFILVLGVRLGAYVVCLWAMVFLLGMFGRMRIPIAVGVIVLLVAADRYSSWQVWQFGPFALIDSTSFPFERHNIPWRAVAESLLLAAGACAAAQAFARLKEGSIVEALARPFGPREVAALTFLGLVVVVVFSTLPVAAEPQPYEFTTDRVVHRGHVEIGYFDDELQSTAETLAEKLTRMLDEMVAELGWNKLPPVRVVNAPDVRAGQSALASNDHEMGVVIRTNLAQSSDVMATRLLTATVHALVSAHTRHVAMLEPRHWLLDGYALHLALRGRASPTPPTGMDAFWMDALAAAHRVPVGPAFLRDYHQANDKVGDDGANALSESGWRVLESEAGRGAVVALARAAFGAAGTGGMRDSWRARQSTARLFATAVGRDWDGFVSSWSATLTRDRTRSPFREALAAIEQAEAAVELRRAGARPVAIRARLNAPAGTICTVYEQKLPPYDGPLDTDAHEGKHFLWPAGNTVERLVEGDYGSGERAFVALDCELTPFAGRVRLLGSRVTIP
ncbi:MAG: hypothetical protein SF187_22630 [Deltaproteobacteria bacterium]|nr:hypothetical protein [Deltaproteobacteria bacterium]